MGKKKKSSTRKEKKYSIRDFFIDIGLVILGLIPSFVYGGLRAAFSWEPNRIITLIIAFGVWAALLQYRPYASLYYGILNLNLIMIALTAYKLYMLHKNKA